MFFEQSIAPSYCLNNIFPIKSRRRVSLTGDSKLFRLGNSMFLLRKWIVPKFSNLSDKIRVIFLFFLITVSSCDQPAENQVFILHYPCSDSNSLTSVQFAATKFRHTNLLPWRWSLYAFLKRWQHLPDYTVTPCPTSKTSGQYCTGRFHCIFVLSPLSLTLEDTWKNCARHFNLITCELKEGGTPYWLPRLWTSAIAQNKVFHFKNNINPRPFTWFT